MKFISEEGSFEYFSKIFSEKESRVFFENLWKEIAWQHDELVIFGKRRVTKRKVAWHGDAAIKYTYSGTTRMAQPWTPLLMEIKLKVEQKSGLTFNACLLNLYHNGDEGMGWHSDNEKSLEEPIHVASLSFGAERRFDMKHQQSGEKKSVKLENGSLLLMKHPMQHFWKHALPKTKKVREPRINLTFRLMKITD